MTQFRKASVIRTGLTFATLTGATLWYGPPVGVLGALGRVRAANRLIVGWSRALLWSFGVRVEAVGLEHAQGMGPCVILSSHRSHLDGPILLCTLPFDFSFVIKRSLARIPLWGWAVRRAGYVPIDRKDPKDSLAGMRRAAQLVREGRRVLTFPEGTRSPDDEFRPFKKGGIVLAIEAQVPILPVAVVGSYDLLPKGAMRARPGPVVVVVGAPIRTEGLTYDDRESVRRECETVIHRLYAEGRERLPRIASGG